MINDNTEYIYLHIYKQDENHKIFNKKTLYKSPII